MVAREDFGPDEKLSLRWSGPRRTTKALSDFVVQVEDLRNGKLEDIHGTRLKYYRDSSLDNEVIMSHVLATETGMPISRLLRLEEVDGSLYIALRWKGLQTTDETLEPLERVFEDAPNLV